jgi:hypothetical protein
MSPPDRSGHGGDACRLIFRLAATSKFSITPNRMILLWDPCLYQSLREHVAMGEVAKIVAQSLDP